MFSVKWKLSCHTKGGGRGSKTMSPNDKCGSGAYNMPKKCNVLFQWPLRQKSGRDKRCFNNISIRDIWKKRKLLFLESTLNVLEQPAETIVKIWRIPKNWIDFKRTVLKTQSLPIIRSTNGKRINIWHLFIQEQELLLEENYWGTVGVGKYFFHWFILSAEFFICNSFCFYAFSFNVS